MRSKLCPGSLQKAALCPNSAHSTYRPKLSSHVRAMNLSENAEQDLVCWAISNHLHSLTSNFLLLYTDEKKTNKQNMPVATIYPTVQVQEQTFEAFLNWLRIVPIFFFFFFGHSPTRNAEGNLHTSLEVSPQGAERRFEMSVGGGGSILEFIFQTKKPTLQKKKEIAHRHCFYFIQDENLLKFSDSKTLVEAWSRIVDTALQYRSILIYSSGLGRGSNLKKKSQFWFC